MTSTEINSTIANMSNHEIKIAIAKACNEPVWEELGIRYKDGRESWGNSPEYTAQKCENYQRQGLGCELIKREQTVDSDFDPAFIAFGVTFAPGGFQ